jgi:type IV pilus assembly protein PilB
MHNSFLDFLIKQQKITPENRDSLLAESISQSKAIEDLILSNGLLSEQELTKLLADFNHIPFVRLAEIGTSPEAISMIDEKLSKRYQVLPFAINKTNNMLMVAMKNPLDMMAINFLSQKTGLSLTPYYASPSELSIKIEEVYADNLSEEVTEALQENEAMSNERKKIQNLSDLVSKGIMRSAPIAKIVENILSYAVNSNSSDVHIEPQENRVRVRYRIDGILSEKLILPKTVQNSLVSRVKILAKMKIDEKRIPQDGRFNFMANGVEVDLRVSSLPTIHGEKVVMRLLRKAKKIPTMQELGMSGISLERFNKAIAIPHGIILVTGPTGSGKTTTLYSALHLINKVSVNILTLEDPVEYEMKGVSQVQTNVKAGLTFSSGLRSFLRQDPDVIMVGEIRDQETAKLAVQASLTGHLVFSTIHTNSAAGSIPRLSDMGIEPFLIASSLTLAMGQRVARRLNPKYAQEYKPEPAIIADMKKVLGPHLTNWCQKKGKDPDDITLYKPSDNRPNNEDGYKGRIAIYEVMLISNEITKLILANRPAREIEDLALEQGMLLMKQDGYLKVLEGVTTIEEILRVAQV